MRMSKKLAIGRERWTGGGEGAFRRVPSHRTSDGLYERAFDFYNSIVYRNWYIQYLPPIGTYHYCLLPRVWEALAYVLHPS